MGGQDSVSYVRGDVRTRLLAKVDTTDPDKCWTWQDSLAAQGYGHLKVLESGRGITRSAHRLSYQTFVGPIPEGLTLDHLCRNRACINPAHLEPVTLKENIMRGQTLAATQASQTHCKNGHPLSGDNLRIYRGHRHCRACAVVYQWAYRRGYL